MKIENLIISIILFFGITILNAQSWTQIGNALNGDAKGDNSGYTVRLSGDGTTVAIAAIENDNNSGYNSNNGQVKVFRNENGNWDQIGNDIYGDMINEQFGRSLGINYDGSIIAIGTDVYDNADQTISGHVKIFENKNGDWVQIGDDINGKIMEEFGWAIDMNSDGSIIAISSKLVLYGIYGGVVRVYKNVSGTWTKLGEDILGENNGLGFSISLNSKGNIIAMSALTTEGYVKIKEYDEDTKMWKTLGDNRIVGNNYVDLFGRSVSLNADGNILAVGAPLDDENGESSGETRVYKNISGTWTQIGNSINGEYHKESGMSVSLSADGTIVAIGSPVSDGMNNNVKDCVKIYRYKNGTWNQLGETITEAEAYSWFGYSVSLSAGGSTVAVGAFSGDSNFEDSGQTRIYTYGGSLGVDDYLSKSKVTVYPNPTKGHLAVNSNISIAELDIYNLLGQLIMTKKNRNDIDISKLDHGLYLLKIQDTDGKYESRKIIKQ